MSSKVHNDFPMQHECTDDDNYDVELATISGWRCTIAGVEKCNVNDQSLTCGHVNVLKLGDMMCNVYAMAPLSLRQPVS